MMAAPIPLAHCAAEPRESWRADWPLLLAVALMYVSLGAVLGFIQGGLPPILRSRGVDLAAMRWVFALYVPFGIAFLWAPWIDRQRQPWLGHRTDWIVGSQGVAVVLILVLALHEALPPAALFALGLAATVAIATMDLALDALTVEQVSASHRAFAAGAKVGGMSVGAVLGGGVLVGLFPALGWRTTFALIAALVALATVPVLSLVRRDRATRGLVRTRPALVATLRRPAMLRRLVRISLVTCALMALFNFNRLMLVDLQVPLARIGWVLGTVAPMANLCASVVVPWLLLRLPRVPMLWGLVGACLATAALTAIAFVLRRPDLATAGAILIGACVTSIYIVFGSLILAWAVGDQPATDYALLYGVGRLIGTLVLLALPGWIAFAGWPMFYAGCAIALVGVVWIFMREIRGASA